MTATISFGLRRFRESDNPRRIHWKASAKHGFSSQNTDGWLIREMEKEVEGDLPIVLPGPEEFNG